MVIQRREERIQTASFPTEVVNTDVADVGPVEANLSAPARTTAHETASFTSDPYAVRREQALRVQKGIYLLFGILEGLLGIRFIMGLLGAGPTAGFAQFVRGITAPFIAPFVGLFGASRFEGNIVDWNALVAIIVYALVAWVLVRAAGLLLGDTRRGVRTTSSQIDTHSSR